MLFWGNHNEPCRRERFVRGPGEGGGSGQGEPADPCAGLIAVSAEGKEHAAGKFWRSLSQASREPVQRGPIRGVPPWAGMGLESLYCAWPQGRSSPWRARRQHECVRSQGAQWEAAHDLFSPQLLLQGDGGGTCLAATRSHFPTCVQQAPPPPPSSCGRFFWRRS